MRKSLGFMFLVLGTLVWAQQGPGPGGTQVQMSADQKTILDADVQEYKAKAKGWDEERKKLDDQRRQIQSQENPSRTEFETLVRAQQDLGIQAELARFDLEQKWRKVFGVEKTRVLIAKYVQGPEGPGPKRGPGPQGEQGPPPPQGN